MYESPTVTTLGVPAPGPSACAPGTPTTANSAEIPTTTMRRRRRGAKCSISPPRSERSLKPLRLREPNRPRIARKEDLSRSAGTRQDHPDRVTARAGAPHTVTDCGHPGRVKPRSGAEPDGVHPRVPHHPRVAGRGVPGDHADRELPRVAPRRRRCAAARAALVA